jgi:N-acyl-D-aspartate/D-glutamate deacylase
MRLGWYASRPLFSPGLCGNCLPTLGHVIIRLCYGIVALATVSNDRGDLSLEQAVHELTGRQAEVFGFVDRGRLVSGAHADMTVFALDDLAWSDEEFVSDVPEGGSRMRRPPGGCRYTTVEGVVVQEVGQLTGANPGSIVSVG